jgi:hypothetical protein
MNEDTQKTHTLVATIMVCISLAVGWFIAEYTLAWYNEKIARSSKMEPGLMRYHPQQGWTLSPSWQGKHQHYDFGVTYSTNFLSLRNGASRSAPLPHQKSKPRTALVGDSFTFGFGVNDTETFHAQLSQLDPNNEYINFSVPGYSTDQQYLLIKEQASSFSIDHYILVFYLGNDLLDNPLPFPLQAARGKPFFELQEQQLQLKNSPVPKTTKTAALQSSTLNSIIFGDELTQYTTPLDRVRASSQLLSMMIPSSASAEVSAINKILERRLVEQEKLLLALLTATQKETQQQNSKLTLALLPGQSYIISPTSYSAYFQDYVRIKTKKMAASLGIDTIDIAEQLSKQYRQGDVWFHPNEGHLTAEGHKKLAEIINTMK